jgi:hypothetical protein
MPKHCLKSSSLTGSLPSRTRKVAEGLLESFAAPVEAHVHERVALLRPDIVAERIDRFRSVVGDREKLREGQQRSALQRDVKIAVLGRRAGQLDAFGIVRRHDGVDCGHRARLSRHRVRVLQLAEDDVFRVDLHRHDDLGHAFFQPRRQPRLALAEQVVDVFAVELLVVVDLDQVRVGPGRRIVGRIDREDAQRRRRQIDDDRGLLAILQKQARRPAIDARFPRRHKRIELRALAAKDQRGRHAGPVWHRPHEGKRLLEHLEILDQPPRRPVGGIGENLEARDGPRSAILRAAGARACRKRRTSAARSRGRPSVGACAAQTGQPTEGSTTGAVRQGEQSFSYPVDSDERGWPKFPSQISAPPPPGVTSSSAG